MKRTAIFLFVLLCAGKMAFAQEVEIEKQGPKVYRANFNEITLSYGTLSTIRMAHDLGTGIGRAPGGSSDKKYKGTSTGSFGLEYMRYTPSGRWAFGGIVAYENSTEYAYKKDDGTLISKTPYNCLTVMPSAKVVWANGKHCGLYSKVAAGVATSFDTDIVFAFQLDPIGFDFGSEVFRGFIQLGFGYTGIFQFGLKFLF